LSVELGRTKVPIKYILQLGQGSVVELAKADATVEQLLAMKVGDFIELERQSIIEAKVDGVPIFECQYGTHKGKYALKIERSLRSASQSWNGDNYDH